MFKAQKGNKDIDKIVHVVFLGSYENAVCI